MSAASDARERLESLLWQYGLDVADVDRVLAVADACALARVQEAVQAGVQAELERIRQARREAMAAAQRGDVQDCGTPAAATRHRRHGDVPPGKTLRDICPPCADAEAADARESWRTRRTTAERTGSTR